MVLLVLGYCVHFMGLLWDLPCLQIVSAVVVQRLEGSVHAIVGLRCLRQYPQTQGLLGMYLQVCHRGYLFEQVVLPIHLFVQKTLLGLMMTMLRFHTFVISSTVCILCLVGVRDLLVVVSEMVLCRTFCLR